jgi:hypothetical protein
MERSRTVRAKVAGWTIHDKYIVDSFNFTPSEDFPSGSYDDQRTEIIEAWCGQDFAVAINCIDSAELEEQ